MLKNILEKVGRRYNVGRPRVVVGVPSGITEVEERAVEESVMQAGAKEVYLVEEPMAAAIGASLDVAEPSGNMIVDIRRRNHRSSCHFLRRNRRKSLTKNSRRRTRQ